MEFNHLDDTRYPFLDKANPYAFKNEFDYTRWTPATKIRLINVLWNSDYDDVVKFDDDAARDAYFEGVAGENVTLTSNQTITPDGTVRIPLPYDVASRYNYIMVQNPMVTPDGNPVEYEDGYGVRNWYFFIDACTYLAPSTTLLRISLDTWTNFINDVDIMYMMLARGHAPVAATNVDDYLENPLANNEYLLAPDVNYSEQSVVSDARFQPVGNGNKYICLASTVSPAQLGTLGNVTGDGTGAWGAPTYSDVATRDGYQLQVNGLRFDNGYDYGNLTTPAANWNNSSEYIPNNLHVYAFKASDYSFMSDVNRNVPQFLNTVQACYMIADDMFSIGTKYKIAGHDMWDINPVTRKIQYKLSKDMFAYPEKYQRFAKLYTSPYASIEMCDSDGNKVNINIECMSSDTKLTLMGCAAFPYINMRAYLAGANGAGTNTYTWRQLDGTEIRKSIDNGDWRDFCIDMDIPTYALYMDGATQNMLSNYHRGYKNAGRQALVNYHNSVRSANTAMQNGIDLANTANANALNSNASARSNVNTGITRDINNKNSNVDYRSDMHDEGNRNRREVEKNAAIKLYEDQTDIQQLIGEMIDINTQAMAMSAIGSAATGAAQLGIGAMGGASEAGTANGAVGVIGSTFQSAISIGNNAEIQNAQGNNALAMQENAVNDLARQRSESDYHDLNVTNRTNQLTNEINNHNIIASAEIGDRNKTTGDVNANRTRNTSNANSGYTRGTAVTNSKEILENALNGARASYMDARNALPVARTSASGNHASDAYANRGISLKVRTQPIGAIRQTGDMFARYGYALNQVWDVGASGLNLMRNFTYWQSEAVWVDDRRSSNNDVNAELSAIFNRGVTVWRDPSKVGKVSIYDN